MRIGIIGTAFRKEVAHYLSVKLYTDAFDYLVGLIDQYEIAPEQITMVSGGAAGIDHLAVSMFKTGRAGKLELHFPAPLNSKGFDPSTRDGDTANYYHERFSAVVGTNTLESLYRETQDLRCSFKTYNGFKARNIEVGKVDHLIAMTFGTHSGTCVQGSIQWTHAKQAGLADGGTAHTWQCSPAFTKTHINLHEFLERK